MKLLLQGIEVPLGSFTLTASFTAESCRLGIFGPSGAGKTTLLEVICGLRKPKAGRVVLDGKTLTDRSARVHIPAHERRIGYVPQDLALFPHMNVRRNLLYGARREAPGPFVLESVARIFEIETLLERGVTSLSGGERQRVALARTLLSAPVLLLLDEPLSSLDTRLKERILACLRNAQHEFAIPTVCVTHDRGEAAALCDLVVQVERGCIVGQCRPEEL